MRRKDGKKKIRARRNLPKFSCGFRESPQTASYRHPSIDGKDCSKFHNVLSMFSGCGGLDLGLMGGFQVLGNEYPCLPFSIRAAYDFLEDAIDAYHLNIGPEAKLVDLTKLDPKDMPACEVLAGGFPCQDFSSSGPKVGLSGERGALYVVLKNYMIEHRPKIVIGENVSYLARLQRGEYLETILDEFESVGYRFQVWSLYGPEYGLPQSRRRLFIVGVRDDLVGFPVPPEPTHCANYLPIDEAICDLEEIVDETIVNQSQYFVASRATGGGGQGDHANRRGTVSYCIRANSRGRIQFHYDLERRLTVRECARVQSFPDEFVFPFSTQRNLTLIGNAVPPLLGHAVATSIATYLTDPEKNKTSALRGFHESCILRRAKNEPCLPFCGETH
jgi:DNA (cytosine-5)-methyltransferase 1